jgi:hypothetical protein
MQQIPSDWICYATRCFKPYPDEFGLELLIIGMSIGAFMGLLYLFITKLLRRGSRCW